jgi:pilus assembly protein CpaF
MDDPAVTEIMVNGPHQVFIEISGRITPSPLQFDHADHLAGMISRYFGQANRLINEKEPIASLRLPDGCRVHAVLPPVAPEGLTCPSIRKFTGVRPELPELVQVGFLSQAEADFLSAAVKARQNLFISGGTGTGKTTFLNALSASIPRQERVITIEDSAELDLKDLPNRVRLESRQPGPDQRGVISLSALIQSALRMRPDRILVGKFAALKFLPCSRP